MALLRRELDLSPAIAWLKDLDGRYLHINRHYAKQLGTCDERMRGRRDRELAPRETIDGPRLAGSGAAIEETVQLEYTVGAFERRPPLAVLRFVVYDEAEGAVGICGVAAPLGDAHLARSECARLMRLERTWQSDPGTEAMPDNDDDEAAVVMTLPAPPRLRPGRHWSPHAQRDLAAVLATANDWRTGLRDAIRILGVHGNWDAVAAWVPNDRQSTLRCLTNWTAREDLRRFETMTWQRHLPIAGTQLGRALFSDHATVLSDLAGSDDPGLRVAADENMRHAMLVPIRDGRSAVAVLELLSSAEEPIDEELTVSIEAVALQLAHFRRLLRMAAQPRWRLGRF
jgi:PAS domain-containing protein